MEIESITKKVKGMVFQKLGGIVLSSVDSLVISSFLGLTYLALYQNYYYFIYALNSVLSIIMASIIPVVGNCVVTDSVQKNYNDFKKYNFIYIWIVSWWSSCLLCLYQPTMRIWVGESRMFNNGMVILFSFYFFVHKWCDMLYVYQEAIGIWWETRFVPLLAALMNLVINLLLINLVGLPGILLSTIIAVVLVYDLGYAKILFITYFREMDCLNEYWRRQLLYLGTAVISAFSCFLACDLIIVNSPFLKLIANMCICIFIPNVVFCLCWSKSDEFIEAKKLVVKVINERINKNVC